MECILAWGEKLDARHSVMKQETMMISNRTGRELLRGEHLMVVRWVILAFFVEPTPVVKMHWKFLTVVPILRHCCWCEAEGTPVIVIDTNTNTNANTKTVVNYFQTFMILYIYPFNNMTSFPSALTLAIAIYWLWRLILSAWWIFSLHSNSVYIDTFSSWITTLASLHYQQGYQWSISWMHQPSTYTWNITQGWYIQQIHTVLEFNITRQPLNNK